MSSARWVWVTSGSDNHAWSASSWQVVSAARSVASGGGILREFAHVAGFALSSTAITISKRIGFVGHERPP